MPTTEHAVHIWQPTCQCIVRLIVDLPELRACCIRCSGIASTIKYASSMTVLLNACDTGGAPVQECLLCCSGSGSLCSGTYPSRSYPVSPCCPKMMKASIRCRYRVESLLLNNFRDLQTFAVCAASNRLQLQGPSQRSIYCCVWKQQCGTSGMTQEKYALSIGGIDMA